MDWLWCHLQCVTRQLSRDPSNRISTMFQTQYCSWRDGETKMANCQGSWILRETFNDAAWAIIMLRSWLQNYITTVQRTFQWGEISRGRYGGYSRGRAGENSWQDSLLSVWNSDRAQPSKPLCRLSENSDWHHWGNPKAGEILSV